MLTPTHVYKIVPSSVPLPSPLPGRLPVSELDSTDGFLHTLTAVQILGTLICFFGNASEVFILRIEYKNVEKNIKWQDQNGGKYFDINTIIQLFTTCVYSPRQCGRRKCISTYI